MTKRCPASPSPVAPEETVARGIYSPDIFDTSTGRATVAAITINELISAGGIIDQCGDSFGVSVFLHDRSEGYGYV